MTRDSLRDSANSSQATRSAFSTSTNPVVSIVVVDYNKAHFTLQCIGSLRSSTIPMHEVIIVENASSDDTSLLLSMIQNARVYLSSSVLILEGSAPGPSSILR